MAKRLLADVIWQAANSHLAMGHAREQDMRTGVFNYSCCAVLEALRPGWYRRDENFDDFARLKGMKFLKSLGCHPATAFFRQKYTTYGGRQSARYMWLLLAAKVAEDEGIEV